MFKKNVNYIADTNHFYGRLVNIFTFCLVIRNMFEDEIILLH